MGKNFFSYAVWYLQQQFARPRLQHNLQNAQVLTVIA